jgi:hypothetical protein
MSLADDHDTMSLPPKSLNQKRREHLHRALSYLNQELDILDHDDKLRRQGEGEQDPGDDRTDGDDKKTLSGISDKLTTITSKIRIARLAVLGAEHCPYYSLDSIAARAIPDWLLFGLEEDIREIDGMCEDTLYATK